MALIKCTECGQMVSDKASRCPKCGCPTKEETVQHEEDVAINDMPVYYEEESHFNKWLYILIALLLAVIAGGGYLLYEKNMVKENPKEFSSDSSTIIDETKIDESSLVPKESGLKVEGYKVIGNSDDLNLRLCVNVDGRLMKTEIGYGMSIVEVLDEHDYDDDGRNECLIFSSMGGAAPSGCSVVYYNLESESIEDVEFDCNQEPTPVIQNGKWFFSVKEGINTKMFSFDKGKLIKVSDKDKKTSKPQKIYTFAGVFGMEELDEQEKNIQEKFDMDSDGILETLVFHANQSHLYGWGTLMSLSIHWEDGRQVETNMTADEIAILSSKTNGVYDLLFEDKYLCKWNGKEFVEMK